MTKPHDNVLTNHPSLWLDLLPKLTANSNKYTRGHTLIVGGYPLTGASRLSAYAAARVGSGLTTLFVPEVAFAIYAGAMTSIMVKPFGDIETFNQFIHDTRITCFLIGPGAAAHEDTCSQSLQLLATHKPVVLDADALTVFQGALTLLSSHLHDNCVLTPHEGEFKRLFSLTDNRVESAQLAAKACGAVIVLKGSKTIIAAPNGQTIVNDHAPPTLATGGAGDVLAGLIAGLIAQGMPTFDAACAAVWIHGEAANLYGIGLIAEDLPPLLLQVLKALERQ